MEREAMGSGLYASEVFHFVKKEDVALLYAHIYLSRPLKAAADIGLRP